MGKLPTFFNFWLKSCEENKNVDFLLITDCNIKTEAKNVILYRCTLSDIKQRAERLLGFSVCLERPHKLCDYKALYGLLFSEYSEMYDFWGYCDSDLIFGNIRHFLNDEILSNYNYILGMGHFHIQRTNDPQFNNVWQSARGVGSNPFYEEKFDALHFLELDDGPQWKEIFKSPMNYIFDEFPYGVSFRYYLDYPERVWTGYSESGRCFDDVDPNPLYFRDIFNSYKDYHSTSYSQLTHVFPFYKRISNGENEIDDVVYVKKNGTLYRIGRTVDGRLIESECLYAHFLHRKMHVKTEVSDTYLIRPNSFVSFEEITPQKMLKWRNDYTLVIERKWQHFVFQVKRLKTLWKKIKRHLD